MDKPLGRKAYGSIGHLPSSRLGPGDHKIPDGQALICEQRARRGDRVIITEKIDGTCVAVARVDGRAVPIVRAGYRAETSPYLMHHLFADWVEVNEFRFHHLPGGWRVVGEWMAQAHGTLYAWDLEPFVVFDLIDEKNARRPWDELTAFCREGRIQQVQALSVAYEPIPAKDAYSLIDRSRYHSIDPPEGLVYRVEREGRVDFLAKWVREDFVPGRYLPSETGGGAIWLWHSREQPHD